MTRREFFRLLPGALRREHVPGPMVLVLRRRQGRWWRIAWDEIRRNDRVCLIFCDTAGEGHIEFGTADSDPWPGLSDLDLRDMRDIFAEDKQKPQC